MTTTTFYPVIAGDGTVYGDDPVFLTARAGLGALGGDDNDTNLYIGSNVGYRCHQACISFDTSSIPDGDTVTAATLSIWVIAHATNHILQVKAYDFGTTITSADFVPGATFATLTTLATLDMSTGITDGAYNAFTEVSNGLRSAISKTGTTRFIINTDKFSAGTAPGAAEYTQAASADTAAQTSDPKLVLTYAPNTNFGTGSVPGRAFQYFKQIWEPAR